MFIGGEPMKVATNTLAGFDDRPSAGRPSCSTPAAIHHHELVGKRHRLDLVMRDVDRGDAEPPAAAS